MTETYTQPKSPNPAFEADALTRAAQRDVSEHGERTDS